MAILEQMKADDRMLKLADDQKVSYKLSYHIIFMVLFYINL